MLRYVCHTHAVAINTKIGCRPTFNIQKLFKISLELLLKIIIKLLISIYINVHVS